MLDRERILAKIDELEGYLHDLRTIAPASFTVYQQIEKNPAGQAAAVFIRWRSKLSRAKRNYLGSRNTIELDKSPVPRSCSLRIRCNQQIKEQRLCQKKMSQLHDTDVFCNSFAHNPPYILSVFCRQQILKHPNCSE